MRLVLGLLLLPVFLYLPGYLWVRVALRSTDVLKQTYVCVAASTIWSGWLALTLAELGWFALPTMVVLTLLCCAVALAVGQRWGLATIHPEPQPRWELWAYGAILVLFALCVSRPFETVLGGRDAGVYPNTGYAIARTGGIVQHEPLIAEIGAALASPDPAIREPAEQVYSNFLGNQGKERFIATRFTQSGFFINEGEASQGRVVPQFFHLYPAWIALWTSLFGLHGGLLATGLLGLLAVWGIALTARQLLPGRRGRLAGLTALLLLAFNTLQIWFSRYTTSDINAQMLLWTGLALWATWLGLPASARSRRSDVLFGGLIGLSIGQLVLTRIDFFWGVGPYLLLLLWVWISHRWQRGYTALALMLLAMLAQGVAHIILISRAYFFDTAFAKLQDTSALVSRIAIYFYTPKLQEVWRTNNRAHAIYFNQPRLLLEIAALGLLLGGLWALWRWPRLLRQLETWGQRWFRWTALGLSLCIGVLIFYAYAIRPQILSWAVVTQPWAHRSVWESFIGAPIPLPADAPNEQQQRVVVLANLVRLGWYLSPLGVLLGGAGLVGWIARDLNRRSALVLLIAVAYGGFYIRDTYGTAEQTYIYIARRFLSGALPAFTLGSAWLVSAWLTARRRWLQLVGAGSLALLLLFLVGTGWRAVRHVEYAGALDTLAAFADQIEPNAVVIMRGGDRDAPSNVATPLRYTFNRDVLVAYSPNPLLYRDLLAAQIERWETEGRPVYLLLGSNGGVLNFPGWEPVDRGLFEMDLPEWQQLQNQKPFTYGWIHFNYRLYALEPAAPQLSQAPVELALTDYRWQLRGFYPPETDRLGQQYAWTDGAAALILPPRAVSSTLELELGLGSALPPSLTSQPVAICPQLIALNQTTLNLPCQSVASQQPQAYRWQLPPLPASGGAWQVSLPSRTWVPNAYVNEYPTPPNDGRALGVQWTGGRWIPAAP